MNHLVIGLGEVGKAVRAVLNCEGLDIKKRPVQHSQYDMLHICFPWDPATDTFVPAVKEYVKKYVPKYVVVHSTVPVGTCDAHGWIHSPVRGVHPNLELGIRTFTKYFGGINSDVPAREFHELGIETVATTHARDTEAIKLWDTTVYGMMIVIEKEIFKWCSENNVDFSLVYQHATKTYNKGYRELGREEVVRPFLKHIEGKIGGHCVIPNAKLLGETWIAETVLEKDKTY